MARVDRNDHGTSATSAHRAALLAWGLAALAAALLVGGFIAYIAADGFAFTALDLFTTAITVAFSIVGALVAKRHPGNSIGWIFLGVAIATGLGGLAHGYVEYRLQSGGATSVSRQRPQSMPRSAGFHLWSSLRRSFSCCFPMVGCPRVAGGRWRGWRGLGSRAC